MLYLRYTLMAAKYDICCTLPHAYNSFIFAPTVLPEVILVILRQPVHAQALPANFCHLRLVSLNQERWEKMT